MATKKRKPNKLKKIILTILGILIIGLVILFVTYISSDQKSQNNNYEIDKNAIQDKQDNEEKMDVSEGGGAVSISYSNIVNINLQEKIINLYLKNPNKSREQMLLEVILKDKNKEIKIAESGLIPPGYEIKKLDLKSDQITSGKYIGYIKVYFVSEDTNEKEIIDTKINVEISVE